MWEGCVESVFGEREKKFSALFQQLRQKKIGLTACWNKLTSQQLLNGNNRTAIT